MRREHLMERRVEAPVCAVFDRCRASPSPAAVRDAALLSVFFGAGLDLAAVVALDRSDYPGGGLLHAPGGPWFRARSGARACLDDWCWIRGDAPGPLFLPLGADGGISSRRPSAESLMAAIRRRMAVAGAAGWDPRALAATYRSPWWREARGTGVPN